MSVGGGFSPEGGAIMASHSGPANGTASRAKSGGKSRKWVMVGFLTAVVALFVTMQFLPVRGYIESFLEWCRGLGFWAPVVLIAAYILACIFFIPGSILTIGAGFLFGVIKGTITVSIASTLGATAAFLIGRTIARGKIEEMVEGKPKFSAIDRAVEKEGFKFVFLTRLSPIFPFNLLNYAFGLTKVPLWKYVLASWIGMIPGTVMYVYIGSGLESLVAVGAGATGEKTTAERVLFWVGLVATVLVATVVTTIARRALRDATPEAVEKEEPDGDDSAEESEVPV